MDSSYGSSSIHILPPGNRSSRSGAMTTGKSDASRLMAAYRHHYGTTSQSQPAQFQPIREPYQQTHHQPSFHHHPHQQAYIPVAQQVQPGYAYVGRYNTVNPGKMKNIVAYKQQPPQTPPTGGDRKQSALNSLFTWKRKSKTTTNSKAGTQSPASNCLPSPQLGHSCQSHSIVPPSLAKLFDKPGKRPSTVKGPQQQKMCICSGLTGSTFMAPSYFDDDDLTTTTTITESTNPKRQSQTLGKKSKHRPLIAPDPEHQRANPKSSNNGQIKSMSTDSLLDSVVNKKSSPNHRNRHTVSERKLLPKSSSKSMELFSSMDNRKSILVCDVNPYELVSDSEEIPEKVMETTTTLTKSSKTLKNSKKQSSLETKSFKSATVALKSSRKSQQQSNGDKVNTGSSISHQRIYYDTIDCVDPPYQCGSTRQRSTPSRHKSIFNAANSIRIAGQSVYSSMKFDGNYIGTDCDGCDQNGDSILMDDSHIIEPIEFKNRSITRLVDIQNEIENVTMVSNGNVSATLPRSKSDISLTTSPCFSCDRKVKSKKFVEPEPDYDMEDGIDDDHNHRLDHNLMSLNKEKSRRSKIVTKSTDRIDSMLSSNNNNDNIINQIPAKSKSTYSIFRSYGRKSSLTSLLKPRTSAPPPPPVPPPPSSSSLSTLPPMGVPAPPPPPPDDYFLQSSASSVNSSTTSISSMVIHHQQHHCPTITPNSISKVNLKKRSQQQSQRQSPGASSTTTSTSSDSYQNELKEKLNRGVKSILKKTNFPVSNAISLVTTTTTIDQCDSGDSVIGHDENTSSGNHRAMLQPSSPKISHESEPLSIEGRIKEFESGSQLNTLPKPKKHVHFRVKRNSIGNSLNRSRSTSHIITETIEEEDDEHLNYYDDVAQPPATPQSLLPAVTRSVDDLIGSTAANTTNASVNSLVDANHFESPTDTRGVLHPLYPRRCSPKLSPKSFSASSTSSPTSPSSSAYSTSSSLLSCSATLAAVVSIDNCCQQTTVVVDNNRLSEEVTDDHHVNVVIVNNVNDDNRSDIEQTTETNAQKQTTSFEVNSDQSHRHNQHHHNNNRELLSMLYDDNSYSNNNSGSLSSTSSPMSRLRNCKPISNASSTRSTNAMVNNKNNGINNRNHCRPLQLSSTVKCSKDSMVSSPPLQPPPPPPIPARRTIGSQSPKSIDQNRSKIESKQTKENKNNTNNNINNRSVRSYSTGSVRSLLARKLNRKIENVGNSEKSRPRLQLSSLFVVPTNPSEITEDDDDLSFSASSSSSSLDNELDRTNLIQCNDELSSPVPSSPSSSTSSSSRVSKSPPMSDHADEHIYEELDTDLYCDSSSLSSAAAIRANPNSTASIRNYNNGCASSASSTASTSSSFFGTRISRAEILDYLLDARGRLEKRIKEVEDDTNLLAVYDETTAVNIICNDNDSGEHHEEARDTGSGSGVISAITTIAPINDIDLNNDSGNSSLCLGEDYNETLACFMSAKKYKLKSKMLQNGSGVDGDTSGTGIVNRRNRVSNVSNASSDSSATSGVSVSNLTLEDDAEEEDGITTSNSSLGSVENSTLSSNGSSKHHHFNSYSPYRGGSDQLNTVSNIERNDSGVGNEIIPDNSKCLSLAIAGNTGMSTKQLKQHQSMTLDSNIQAHLDQLEQKCIDCDAQLDESIDHKLTSIPVPSGDSTSIDVHRTPSTTTETPKASPNTETKFYFQFAYVCQRCEKRRNERKEIISEFVDTELKYGRDLKIILEEFLLPISVAGLLTQPQVDDIFLNLGELIEVNCQFAQRLQTALDDAFELGDEDLTTISIGHLFHQCLLAQIAVFERYCIRQASASLQLNQLEKEKELLRVFLRVSQMENALLRRMNLRSFLVVPVQRVTKYPLLLNRLHKVTPHHYQDYDSLREAQLKLEFHLENINQKTRGSIAATTSRIWRRISNLSSASIRSRSNLGFGDSNHNDDFGYLRLKRTALDLLKDWPKDEIRFVLVGKLSYIVEKSGTSSEQINHHTSSTYGSIGALNLSSSGASGFGQSIANSASLSSSTSKIWSKTLKFSNANAVLVTHTVPAETSGTEFDSNGNNYDSEQQSGNNMESDTTDQMYNSYDSRRSSRTSRSFLKSSTQNNKSNLPVREAVLLLFKEKNGRYVLCRDILNLAMCVIANATDVDSDEFFEIHELESRESLLLKAETKSEMQEWLELLRSHSKNLGNWRRRRNALPNIMVLRNVMDSSASLLSSSPLTGTPTSTF